MDGRVEGVKEIYERVKKSFTILGLEALEINPLRPIVPGLVPCVMIYEGDDRAVKKSSQSTLGYPAEKELEVIVDCWKEADELADTIDNAASARVQYLAVKTLILANDGLLKSDLQLYLKEGKTTGPFGLPSVPKAFCIRQVYLLGWSDEGI